jgi:hypothetical protein
MTKTQIVIFILVILGNGVMALWKKHKDRQAQQAAARLGQPAGGAEAIDTKIAVRKARRAQAQQPPVIPTSPRPAASAGSGVVAFEDVVRVEMRRLAAMQAVLAAAGGSAGAGPSDRNEREAVSPVVPQSALAARVVTAPGGHRLLGTMSLRQALIAREVLGPPRAASPWTGSPS